MQCCKKIVIFSYRSEVSQKWLIYIFAKFNSLVISLKLLVVQSEIIMLRWVNSSILDDLKLNHLQRLRKLTRQGYCRAREHQQLFQGLILYLFSFLAVITHYELKKLMNFNYKQNKRAVERSIYLTRRI